MSACCIAIMHLPYADASGTPVSCGLAFSVKFSMSPYLLPLDPYQYQVVCTQPHILAHGLAENYSIGQQPSYLGCGHPKIICTGFGTSN